MSATEPGNLVKSMKEWQFSSSSVLGSNLPIDPETEVYIRNYVKVSMKPYLTKHFSEKESNCCYNPVISLQGAIYSRVQPSPLVKNVKLVSYSNDVLVNILNMHPSITDTEDFVQWIAGSNVLSSSTPLAHRYGGHQFGSWAAQLGDGRALSLGEYVSQ